MKKFLLISVLALIVYVSSANERTEQEMRNIASEQLGAVSNVKGNNQVSDQLRLFESKDNYSIYGYADGGMVVVSRDDAFSPVLGYSDSKYDGNNMPDGFKWWLSAVDYVMSTSASAVETTTLADFAPVAPFLKAQWGQGDPYNFLSPMDGEVKTPSGCLATAMAQIMYYYKYPASGTGSGYYTVGSSASRFPVKISSVYEWDKMLPTYSPSMLNDHNREPVARLLSDAAASCYMNFSAGGSGAMDIDAIAGFVDNFSYDASSLRRLTRDNYSDSEWMPMVYSELMNQNAILYCGADKYYGGHAFVFDGIDSDGNVHVNWGWDGSADGFYSISMLNPTGILGTVTPYAFNVSQSMILGFRPQPTPEGYVCPSQFVVENEISVKSTISRSVTVSWEGFLYNASYRGFKGQIYIRLENVEDASEVYTSSIYDNSAEEALMPLYSSQVLIDGSKFYREPKLKSGATYKLGLYSCSTEETEPQPIRSLGGLQTFLITLDEAGKVVDIATGIDAVPSAPAVNDNRIYNQNGVFAGTDSDALPSGIYVQNGKKFVK